MQRQSLQRLVNGGSRVMHRACHPQQVRGAHRHASSATDLGVRVWRQAIGMGLLQQAGQPQRTILHPSTSHTNPSGRSSLTAPQ
eukprot:353574-Chlamydomonas_euryale.AAC.2